MPEINPEERVISLNADFWGNLEPDLGLACNVKLPKIEWDKSRDQGTNR